jgi:transposase
MTKRKKCIDSKIKGLEPHQEPPHSCLEPTIALSDPPINNHEQDDEDNQLYNDFETQANWLLYSSLLARLSAKFNPFVIFLIGIMSFAKALLKKINDYKHEIVRLKARLNMDSSNSSMAPSKSFYNRSKKIKSAEDETEKRKPGGQPGHERHVRKPFDPKEADRLTEHELEPKKQVCPHCGGGLVRAQEKDRQYDQYHLPKLHLEKIVDIVHAYQCSDCGKFHFADAPKDVLSRRLLCASTLALLVFLKGAQHQSIRLVQALFGTLFALKMSLGFINNSLKEASFALRPIFFEMLHYVAKESVLNIDETGHKNGNTKAYVWVFAGPDMVCFRIGTRSSYLLEFVLGPDYDGIIMCDCYQVYFSFMKKCPRVKLQLCLAHLLREFKFCADTLEPRVAEYGNRGLELLREIFSVYHQYADETDKDSPLARQLRDKLLELKRRMIEAALDAPRDYDRPRLLAKRFEEFGEYYFSFIDNPLVEPTNNEAERCLRAIVIDRKICYGTQSRDGVSFCETIWSILGTLKKKGIEPMPFITEAIQAHESGQPLPSLVNIGGHVDPVFVEQARQEKEEILQEKQAARAKKLAKAPNTSNPSANDPVSESAGDPQSPGPRPSPSRKDDFPEANPSPSRKDDSPEANPSPSGKDGSPEANLSPSRKDGSPEANPSPSRKDGSPKANPSPSRKDRPSLCPDLSGGLDGPQRPNPPTLSKETCPEGPTLRHAEEKPELGTLGVPLTVEETVTIDVQALLQGLRLSKTYSLSSKDDAPVKSYKSNAIGHPPKDPFHRRVLAPEPAFNGLEPAQMGPTASL